ncbi:MAG: class I SAM-dependent methyltransferase [Ilumatobacter sp.]
MDEVGQAYDDMAEPYIDLVRTTEVHARDLALIERHLTIRPGTVLDAGCGPGHLTAHLRSLEVDAIGLDVAPRLIDHARATHPVGRYELASIRQLPHPDRSVAAILAWYSLIHVPPDELDAVLVELRRVMNPGGTLVAGFFDGDAIAPFDHKVTTAYFWPVAEFSARLLRAGFTEIERDQRPLNSGTGNRRHAAIAARTTGRGAPGRPALEGPTRIGTGRSEPQSSNSDGTSVDVVVAARQTQPAPADVHRTQRGRCSGPRLVWG